MKKYILIVIITVFFISGLKAQVFTGGNTTFDFANGNIYIDAAPIVGYRIKKFETGVSPFVSYAKPKNTNSSLAFGGRIFSQINILKGAFAHVEIEGLNSENTITDVDGNIHKERIWTIALPVGGGYKYNISNKVTVHGMVLYDLLLDPDSPKENPQVRGGVIYNF